MKRLFRILLWLVITALFLELGLRVFFYQHKTKEELALFEAYRIFKAALHTPRPTFLYKGYFLARPDSGETINKKIALEEYQGNRLVYSPWIDYKNIDFKGEYLNVNGLVRASSPDEFINPASPEKIVLYFLGGSTMFGVNATDRETIPASFVNLYRERYREGRSIQVVNYGQCGATSYGELMLLSHLLYSGDKPSMLVVFDGLNDFLLVNAAQKRLPYYYYHLKATGKDDIDYGALKSISDSTNGWFDQGASGPGRQALGRDLLDKYTEDLKNMKELAAAHRATPFFFIQPTPYYHYPNRKNDPVCATERNEILEQNYAVLEKKADSIGDCTFLGNLLEQRKGYPFIDHYHYSPAMSVEIARAMLDVVGKKINGR
jgi:hypothetical protein